MVLDLDLFREDKGGDPDRVRSNVRARFADVKAVDNVIDLDNTWRKSRHTLDQLNKAKNTTSKAIGKRMKQLKEAGKEVPEDESDSKFQTFELPALLQKIENGITEQTTLDQLKNLRQQVENHIIQVNKQMDEYETKRNDILREIGNLLHPDVLISDNEDENLVIRTWGNIELGTTGDIKYLSHVDLIQMIGGMDGDKGSEISGSRGYFLLGPCIWLQQALIQYALRYLDDLHYQLIYTPFWMKKSLMGQVAQLSQFDEELYKVISSKDNEDAEDKYLIATSEQPLAALHRGEWLNPSSLPIKYGGLSTCFRQEVGAHGRDTRGIFRVHQFEKVEQFVLAAPNKSWDSFNEMIENSEKFNQSLGIPYRIVSIVSGALNNAAAMKYDLEAWFPGSQAFRELVSVSNCTDYQARRLQVRFGQTKKMTGQVEYVHMLNGTLCALTRTICAILEVHQTPEGIRIPDALKPFMPSRYKDLIPFINQLQTNNK